MIARQTALSESWGLSCTMKSHDVTVSTLFSVRKQMSQMPRGDEETVSGNRAEAEQKIPLPQAAASAEEEAARFQCFVHPQPQLVLQPASSALKGRAYVFTPSTPPTSG